jgi:hypothetical protein
MAATPRKTPAELCTGLCNGEPQERVNDGKSEQG